MVILHGPNGANIFQLVSLLLQGVDVSLNAIQVVFRDQDLVGNWQNFLDLVRTGFLIPDLEHHQAPVPTRRNQVLVISRHCNFFNSQIVVGLEFLHMLGVGELVALDGSRITVLVICAAE